MRRNILNKFITFKTRRFVILCGLISYALETITFFFFLINFPFFSLATSVWAKHIFNAFSSHFCNARLIFYLNTQFLWTSKHIKYLIIQSFSSIASKQENISRAKPLVLGTLHLSSMHFGVGQFGLALMRLNGTNTLQLLEQVRCDPDDIFPSLFYLKGGLILCSETSPQHEPKHSKCR